MCHRTTRTSRPKPYQCVSAQDDMYDTASRLCQVGNKYAFWFMKHKSWVQCAPNIPGYRMLVSTGADFNGNYWYTVKQAKEVTFSRVSTSISLSVCLALSSFISYPLPPHSFLPLSLVLLFSSPKP